MENVKESYLEKRYSPCAEANAACLFRYVTPVQGKCYTFFVTNVNLPDRMHVIPIGLIKVKGLRFFYQAEGVFCVIN